MKVKTPILEYDEEYDFFCDRDRQIDICHEDARYVFKMKKRKAYRLTVYTKKPKKQAIKFRFIADRESFLRKGEEYEVSCATIGWLASNFGISNSDWSECIKQLDGSKLWVRVKEV